MADAPPEARNFQLFIDVLDIIGKNRSIENYELMFIDSYKETFEHLARFITRKCHQIRGLHLMLSEFDHG